MKIMNVLLSTAVTIALLGSGCTTHPEVAPPSELTTATESEAKGTEEPQETSFLKTAIDLLGKTHEESEAYFESNETLYSADGTYLLGRSFPVTAFGMDTTLYATLNSNNVVNSITIHLDETNYVAIESSMIQQLGEPAERNDAPSESGSTYVMWNLHGRYVYLYKGYGTLDLQLILPDQQATSLVDEGFAAQLPDTIAPVLAEQTPYPLLEKFIIDTYGIPDEDALKTKYYYNYVDFNDDGRDEVFAVVMGPYTSGTGGSSALIAYEFEGVMNAVTTFTLIHTPVIISDNPTKGMKDVIVQRRGGGAKPELVRLTSTGEGHYTSVNDGEPLTSLSGIQGQAIIANDLIFDLENHLFMLLK